MRRVVKVWVSGCANGIRDSVEDPALRRVAQRQFPGEARAVELRIILYHQTSLDQRFQRAAQSCGRMNPRGRLTQPGGPHEIRELVDVTWPRQAKNQQKV